MYLIYAYDLVNVYIKSIFITHFLSVVLDIELTKLKLINLAGAQ